MTKSYDFDLLVIGGGSGGVRAARWSAKLGAKVGLIEKSGLGGTCVIRGCVPKKIMSYAANFREEVHLMQEYGHAVTWDSFSWEILQKKRDQQIQRISGVYENMLRSAGVELFSGIGTIFDNHTVLIKGKKISARYILIAVGSRPAIPGFPGVEHTLTSEQFFQLKKQPQNVLVMGGGYIATEFASILNGLGSRVSIVIRRELILRGFDGDIRRFLQKQLQEKGISFITQTTVQKIEKLDGGELNVYFSDGTTSCYDTVLLAQGRVPNTESLQLDKVGIKHQDGRIEVDSTFQTNFEGVYSIGDCVNQHNLTPVALREGMIMAENLFAQKRQQMDYKNIPTAIFTNPAVGTVGKSEEELKAEGIKADIYVSEFRPLKYFITDLPSKQLMKMVVNANNGIIEGVHVVGQDAPEVIQFIGVAVKAGLKKEDFDNCIGVHPTSAEELVTMREKTRSI